MTLDAPLNGRQLAVLRWVSEGCPEGRWTNFSFKTSAAAVEWRGLVSVSKRGGMWRATVTPAGTHYLANGNYPVGHKLHRVRPPRAAGRDSGRTAPKPRPKPNAPAEQKPTHRLLKEIVDAGGLLQRDLTDDDTNYRHLVSIINRRRMAPDGQQVILNEWLRPGSVVLRLSGVTCDWKSDPLPERISKWNPVVAELKAEKRLDHISASLRPRAMRLFQALVLESKARGHSMRTSRRPTQYAYGEQTGGIVCCMVFEVGGVRCALAIAEAQDRVPHFTTAQEVEKAKRDTWYRIPSHDYVKSGRLQLTLATDSGYSAKVRWTDTDALKLESRLCDVMALYERWAAIDTERKEAERQRQIEARERRAREDELAMAEYKRHALREHLLAELDAWELGGRLRRYVSALEGHVGSIVDADERADALEWVEWCHRHIETQDPLARPIKMPTIKAPGFTELQEARERLGFRYW
ncbi:hypothetical protein A5687_21320 [Mycobacterium mantenii]|uniref:hypothetical protein n=1 Tax=Mycobacterium mantenii TaxID=560555 RepID=UPI0007FDA55B|nr:hypothetical protein [Mycobacterium mantenii]OBH59003.1 hypothetical protein A5687_21320 [Mycobacterium mantenii]